jgi:hypothetical protein
MRPVEVLRAGGSQEGEAAMGETLTLDDAPVVREVRGLVGELTEDEAALVRTLTPADLCGVKLTRHLFELVNLLSTIRYDEAMAEYVYAIAPEWDGDVDTLLLGAQVATLLAESEMARSVVGRAA